jgi:MYXO-CTERM domain-containing protein
MTVDVYVTNNMLSGQGLQQFGLWGNTGTGYPIINFASHDPLDPFNPDSAGIQTMLRTYNTTTGAWNVYDAGDYLTANSWATLEIRGTNQGFDYFVNGTQLGATDLNGGALNLQEGFLQTYNYGQPNPNPFDPVEPTSVMFDNFTVTTVPEPAAAALGGLGLLGLLRRRRA